MGRRVQYALWSEAYKCTRLVDYQDTEVPAQLYEWAVELAEGMQFILDEQSFSERDAAQLNRRATSLQTQMARMVLNA